MTLTHRRIVGVTAILAVMTVRPAWGQDWTQWRGPNRDGAVASFEEPSSWPDSLTRRWQIEVGLGYATPLLVADRLFVFARQEGDEVLMALDAASGSQLWADQLPGAVRDEFLHRSPSGRAEVDADLRRRPLVHAGDERHRDGL